MLTLFYRFSTSSSIAEAGSRILDVFHYIGVSVTTSIAGVLLRNMVRTAWLAAHPDTGSGLAEAVLLLKETAEGFSRNYQTVYDSLNAFLAERRDNAAEFSKSEKAYTKALDACTEAAEHFAGSIKLTENKLTESMDGINSCVRAQMEGIKTLDEVNRDFSAASSRLLKDLDRLPVMQIAESIKVLGRESSELGTVMDSILSIVEKKLERVH
jgi:methyl-accepting chemotaxis protein